MAFYLIEWKEFQDRKIVDSFNIVKTNDVVSALENMKKMNAQKRLTTAEYKQVNLSDLLKDNGLEIVEYVKTEE